MTDNERLEHLKAIDDIEKELFIIAGNDNQKNIDLIRNDVKELFARKIQIKNLQNSSYIGQETISLIKKWFEPRIVFINSLPYLQIHFGKLKADIELEQWEYEIVKRWWD